MNYQEYDWHFDPKAVVTGAVVASKDPWLAIKTPGTCVGQGCCSKGQLFDNTLNQCIGDSIVTESFLTETMVNKVLTKKQPGKHKDDIKLGDYKAHMTNSFINNPKITSGKK